MRLPRPVEELEAEARRTLSPERVRHVAGVAATAVALAERHGLPRPLLVAAAWAHDLWRERSGEELLARARSLGVPISPLEERQPLLLHGPVAASELCAEGWSPEVVEAVRVHTTGAPGMGPVAAALYVADKIEPGRSYPGVSSLRRAAEEMSLTEAVLQVLQSELQYRIVRRQPLHPWAVAAYQEQVGGP
jgi:predicted HD superfamily hydrolase involved in NAD metabolism